MTIIYFCPTILILIIHSFTIPLTGITRTARKFFLFNNMTSLSSSTLPNVSTIADPYRILLDISMAKSRKVRGGNYVQLATVTADGAPKCRTIVQRGLFSHNGASVLKFITDNRSEKVEQIRHRPEGEMVWWFLKTSEQYRISGKLEVIGNDSTNQELLAVRKQTWGELRDTAREQFYWIQPGIPLNEAEDEKDQEKKETENNDTPTGGRGKDGKVLPPPDTFLMMLLRPTKVDYLRLSDNARVVFNHTENKGIWTKQSMSP